MPRAIDPATLSSGGGLSARKSVSATSFVNPTQGLDGTIAHIVDPSRAHMARAVGVEDTAGNFSSDHVEGALAELASGAGNSHLNGVYQGCTFVSAGLTVTLATPSLVMVNGTERTLSGASTALANNATSWLYVDGTTGALTSVIGAPPSISSPENVLLARVTTAGGVVTVSEDARWFVRNIDRKLPFTVRSVGAEADRNSEAAFESLNAALLYLATLGFAGVIKNSTIFIKGSHTFTTSQVIPINGVTLQGEDGCVLTTGAVLAPMFDISGRSGIRIRDITFSCANAGSVAIGCPSSGVLSDVVIERCTIMSGGANWGTGIDFNVAGPQQRVMVRDSSVTAATFGVRIQEPADCRLQDTTISEVAGAGTAGFHFGPLAGGVGSTADSIASGVRVTGFGTGVILRGLRLRLSGCNLTDSDTGINVGTNSGDVTISDCTVRLDATNGIVGAYVQSARVKLTGCHITTQRAVGAYGGGDVPIGLRVANNADFVSAVGCRFEGFLNTVGPAGYGIFTEANSDDFIVDGCTIETAYTGVATSAGTTALVTGTAVRDTDIGMSIGSTGNTISGCTVVSSSTRGTTGITVSGSDTAITGCTIANLFAGGTPSGIVASGGTLKVSNCILRGWSDGAAAGSGMRLAAGSGQVTVDGTTFVACYDGFVSPSAVGAEEVKITGCAFRSMGRNGISIDNSNQVKIDGCTVYIGGLVTVADAIYVANGTDIEVVGCKVFGNSTVTRGIHLQGSDTAANRLRRFVVSGNNVSEVTADGILLEGYVQNGVVSNNQVDCFLPAAPSDPTALACIRLASTGTTDLIKSVTVSGNVCQRAQNGIVVAGNNAPNMVHGVQVVGNTIHHCAVGSAGAGTTCTGVSVIWARNVAVSGNNISVIGLLINNADVEAPPTLADVSPRGVRVLNSEHVDITSNAVEDCVLAGAGDSYGVQVDVEDTTVNFDVRGLSVTDNVVTTSAGVTPMSVGVLVSAGQDQLGVGATTTVNGVVIDGNNVRRVGQFGVYLSSGGGCTMQQVTVSGNVVSSVVDLGISAGIMVEAATSTAFTDGILREVVVSGNNVGDTGRAGILVGSGAGCRLTAVSVLGNTVADAGDIGINIYGTGVPAGFGQFTVSDNKVLGAAGESISITSNDFDLDNVTVTGNTIMGAVGGAADEGIHVETVATTLTAVGITRLTVSGNTVYTDTSVGVNVVVEGTLQQGVFSGNVIEVDGAGATPLLLTLSTPAPVVAEVYSSEVLITGNTFTGGGSTSVIVGNGQKVRNFTYSNNTYDNAGTRGFVFDISDATVGNGEAVKGLTISGNSFSNVDEEGVRILLGDTTTEIDQCTDIVVSGNRFNTCNTDGVDDRVVHVRALGDVINLSVTDNVFTSCGALDDETTGNIDLRLGTDSPSGIGQNLRVVGNTFDDCRGCGVLVHDHTAATNLNIFGLQVDGNVIYSQSNDAVRLNLRVASIVKGVSVSNNHIQAVSNAGATSDTGITVLGPTSAALEQVSIQGNTIRSTGNNNADGGIQVSVVGDATDIKIDGNTVQGATAGTAGIYVTVDGLWLNGSVSNNTVSDATTDGIHLKATGIDAATSGIRGVSVSGNNVDNAGNDGIATSSAVVASTPVLDNFVVSGNTVEDSTGYGIFISGEVLTTVSVTGNTVQSTGADDGIRVNSDGSGDSISVSNNTVSNADNHGISVIIGSDAHGISVNGNSVNQWSVEAGTTQYGGVYVQLGSSDINDEAFAVSVSGNNVRSSNTYSTGLWFKMKTILSGMAITGNTADLSNAANTRSLYFDADTGSQSTLNITGNTLWRAVTGASTASTFAPTMSVCSLNCERTGTGAGQGNWGSGGVGTFTDNFDVNSVVTNNVDGP